MLADIYTPLIAIGTVGAFLAVLVPAVVRVVADRRKHRSGIEAEVNALRRAIVGDADDGINLPAVGLRDRVVTLEADVKTVKRTMATKEDIIDLAQLVKDHGNGHG